MTIGNDGPPVRDPRQAADFDPVAESKHLLRTVRTATLATLRDAARLGFRAVWLQDGSFDDAVLEFARAAPFETVYDACVMVASNVG